MSDGIEKIMRTTHYGYAHAKEIKEILDGFKEYASNENPKKENNVITPLKLGYVDTILLLDYITNLQEEVEDLRESDWAWHQTLKVQNKREYRSKFLKEFQQEYNTNTFPDYDEIYKRYDKLKEENKRLKEVVENLTTMTVCGDRKQIKNTAQYKLDIYKSRNEKAIEYCKLNKEFTPRLEDVENILDGGDKDVYKDR